MKATNSILKRQQRKKFFFLCNLDFIFFVFTSLKICGSKCQQNVQKNFMQKTYIKPCIHFLHFWFFTKIFIHNYIHMWKITTTMKVIKIWIIQYFLLQFIPFKFYMWKIAKKKSLSLVFKKGYLRLWTCP